MRKHIQTETEWQEQMSEKIIDQLQCELYLDMPFMKIALSALSPKADERLVSMATDGTYIYYNPQRLIDTFRKNGKYLDRAYLHSILHCLFFHLWTRGDRNELLWNTACDIMVEYTIDGMDKPSTRRILSYIRKNTYDTLKSEHIAIAPGALYAWLYREYATILNNEHYTKLEREQQNEHNIKPNSEQQNKHNIKPNSEQQNKYDNKQDYEHQNNHSSKNDDRAEKLEKFTRLAREFYTDDHALWPKEEQQQAMPISSSEAKKQWEKISRQTRMEKKRSKDSQSEGESVMMQQLSARRSRRSYSEFLKKFSVLREELHTDPDSFDLGYYAYGLSMYGNMPLIEPLETRETYKIRDFVIVLDTSYSVSGELVEKFLQETFTILTQTDSFFVRNRVRIIQCDDSVKMDEEITDLRQIEPLLNKFTLVGGGGTDFRPAFSYVAELLDKGELKNMCGLLYFTDGKGIFPAKCPPYKCAFVSVGAYEGNEVPPWAMQVEIGVE